MSTSESQARGGDRFLDPKPFPDAPPSFAIRAVMKMRRALQRAADALVPPQLVLFERTIGVADTQGIGLAAKLGISDLLSAKGPLTGAQIAEHLGTDADATHRFLRVMAARDIYDLDESGRFSNNRLSLELKTGMTSRAREWALYFCSDSNLKAWSALEGAVRSGKEAFAATHGMSVWDWFDAHPDEREHFAHAMMGITFMDAPMLASLYPFGDARILCDVGGGRGALLSELLIRYPKMRGILCDAPGVLESARSLLAARGVADRVELKAANFFESVPAGADTYLMKNVLHDWDDERCLIILDKVRRAIPGNGRLVLVDAICERNVTEGFAPLADLQMLVVCGGRERSREDFERLLDAARFRLTRVFSSPTMSVLEAEPR